MISKLRFSLVAVIMLVLVGFGFQDQARGQIGDNGVFCPGLPQTTGWLDTNIFGPAPGNPFPDFSAGWLGTVESFGGAAVGGGDWQHIDDVPFNSYHPTNESGSQVIAWWTQTEGRNSYLQVTNAIDFGVNVHVRIINGETCLEIRNFCDFYTPFDTHVYNFGDLFSNIGQDIDESVLQGREGYVVVTSVDDCPSPDRALEHDFLVGNFFVLDSEDYLYGSATYMRQGVCEDAFILTNLVLNGSFQQGALGPWFLSQGNGGVITSAGINPNVPVQPAVPPDSDDPGSDLFQGWLASESNVPSPSFLGGPYVLLTTSEVINTGFFETNVSAITSNEFTTSEANTLLYNATQGNPTLPCNNYLAVCVVDVATQFNIGCDCYNENGIGFIWDNPIAQTADVSGPCQANADNDQPHVIGPFEWDGGITSVISGSIPIPSIGTYAVQVITGQTSEELDCISPQFLTQDGSGAIVDNFRVLEEIVDPCDGILTGAANAFLDVIAPDQLAGQFNVQNGTAGADAVLINFFDEYGPPYRPLGVFVNIQVNIFDQFEQFTSCGDATVCFIRLGIDANVVNSDDFTPIGPTGTPTVTPTIGPTSPPTIVPPTTQSPSGGSGSCAIAGNPVQLGTAMANVLIPLIPVAFAFGVRAIRRRKK